MLRNLFVIGIITICSVESKDWSIVTLPSGRVQGLEKLSARNHTYHAFFQIPYAQPPLGKLRFRDPQPVKNWDGIFNATEEKTVCYQVFLNLDIEDENCLYVNVYTPVTTGSKRRTSSLAVMVYIHGGGFMSGYSLSTLVGPQHFMDHNVVIVTISYRLGPFGFLSTGDEVIPGNYGLKDQNLALKWVKKNIQYFGGDPNKVTIFGQSSGAVAVGYHILSKQSKGLFRGAIQQSGSVITPHGYQRKAKDFAYQLAKFIDPNFNTLSTSTELLSFLQNVSATTIKTASGKFTEGPGTTILSEGSWFAPVIESDREDAFITENMYESVASGDYNKVPLMVGMTSEEALSQAGDLSALKSVVAQYDSNVSFLVHGDMHITDQNTKILAGNAIRKIYTEGLLQNDLAAAIKYFSDAYVSKCVLKQAELQSKYSDVYFYQFSYHGPLGNNDVYLDGAGNVTHSEDMNYLWAGNNTVNINNIEPKDLTTLDRYITLFTNFAKTLYPIPKRCNLLQITWPKVTPEKFRYLDIGEDLEIKSNPKEAAYKGWVSVYDTWGIRPFDTY